MIKAISNKKSRFSIIFTFLAIFALSAQLICYAMEADVSPYIINIESQRLGEIRIYTDVRFSTFISNEGCAFIYFNNSDSVENITTTRDSLGNLILKFDLVDLLSIESFLFMDQANNVTVVVVMNDGSEYEGYSEVFIVDKKAP